MQLTEIIKKLCLSIGVSGNENAEASEVAKEILMQFGKTKITPFGSVICTVNEAKENQPHLMLNAHIDQIGMIVTNIDDRGFLKVSSCGGIDRRLVLASQVTVHGIKPIKGVVCSVPPHLQEGEAKNQKITDIAIDIGLNKKQAEKIVSLGDRITIDGEFLYLLGEQISAPALDDRAGCAAAIYAAYLLKDKQLNCGLTIALSAQEETTGIGASAAAYEVAPTHALVCDVSFAYTPDIKKHEAGVMGNGGMIAFAASLNDTMSKQLVTLAKQNNIPYQIEVSGAKTSTDADNIAQTGCGV
ncbi:MAG: M42 family peptidase, partial [Oscillospiraceae bacterium]